VRAYVGLVPREWSSGEQRQRGRITKAGHARLRTRLVEAAWSILRYEHAETQSLRAWALRIAARRGKRIAAVALARKLAGILYAMWRDGSAFGQPAPRHPAIAA
jgi:transposase